MIGASLDVLLSFRSNIRPLKFPLMYPDPDGEFYGYDQATKADGVVREPGTSAIFGHIMVLASTLVTLKTGEYNAEKRGLVREVQKDVALSYSGGILGSAGVARVVWSCPRLREPLSGTHQTLSADAS